MRQTIIKLECPRDDQIDKLRHHRMGKVYMGAQEIAGAKGCLSRRPFVKQVIGVTKQGKTIKKLLDGKKSYLDANAIGSRGVYYYWTLDHGQCVQIQESVSRRKKRRYFAIALYGELHEITEKQAALYVHGAITIRDTTP